MKNFCLDLKEHATQIINYEKKGMIPLTKEEKEIHREQKVCYICKNESKRPLSLYWKIQRSCS